MPICNCKFCDNTFYIRQSFIRFNGNYCSKECYRLSKIKSQVRICEVCGKNFIAKLSEIKRGDGKCCSIKCWALKRMKRIKKICLSCKRKFYIRPSQCKKKGGGKFCSDRCQGIWSKSHQKHKNTSIEGAIENELKKQKIPYRKQIRIEGIALVDFLLPNKIIVQCDGDYWHTLPKVKNKDIKQDNSLNSKGYNIFRFSETEINESPKKCIDRIFQTSQICSNCGEIVKKALWNRRHKCSKCGIDMDRDENASINILKLGIEEYHRNYGNQRLGSLVNRLDYEPRSLFPLGNG